MLKGTTDIPDEVTHGLQLGEKWFNLTRDEFDELIGSVRLIRVALRIERGFDQVVENYFEFEQELLKASLGHMLFMDHSWATFIRKGLTLSRRIMNTLSAGGVYFDQLELKEYPTLAEKLSRIKRGVQDKADYRMGRSIRNFMVHRDFDPHQVTWRMKNNSVGDVARLAYSLGISIEGERLRNDRRNRSVLPDTEGKVDVVKAIRRYVEVLGALNQQVRDLLKPDLDQAEDLFQRTTRLDESESDISLLARDEAGKKVETARYSRELLPALQSLRQKNRALKNLSARYVTSAHEVEEPDDA